VKCLLAAGQYVDAPRARDALRRRLQFNVVDARSAFKSDLIVRKERREELEGARPSTWPPASRSPSPPLDLWLEVSGDTRG
jgi:hypothetical protein